MSGFSVGLISTQFVLLCLSVTVLQFLLFPVFAFHYTHTPSSSAFLSTPPPLSFLREKQFAVWPSTYASFCSSCLFKMRFFHLHQADSQLNTERQMYIEASLQYVVKVQEVHECKKFEFVEPVRCTPRCISSHTYPRWM